MQIKAWNEYVIDYYSLRIDKHLDADYIRIEIYQGRLMIYKDIVYQSYSLTPAQMHKRLYKFLSRYREAIKHFGVTYFDANFKPPELPVELQKQV